MGMTYEQFWEQDCQLVVPYREAWKLRQENENRQAWLNGLYLYEALVDVSPVLRAFAKPGTKAQPYPDKPFDFESARKKKKAERNEQKMQNAVNFMHKLASIFNRQNKEKAKDAPPKE